MTCDQVRRLLSAEPVGCLLPRAIALRRHLDHCPDCRRFWQALLAIDEDLSCRPFAVPPKGLSAAVACRVQSHSRQPQVVPPLSRAFWIVGAALTLLGLVMGAVLLHYASAGLRPSPDHWVVNLWLSPTWPSDASAWLSTQGDDVAEVILASLAGIVVALTAALLGFKASQHQAHNTIAGREHTSGPR